MIEFLYRLFPSLNEVFPQESEKPTTEESKNIIPQDEYIDTTSECDIRDLIVMNSGNTICLKNW